MVYIKKIDFIMMLAVVFAQFQIAADFSAIINDSGRDYSLYASCPSLLKGTSLAKSGDLYSDLSLRKGGVAVVAWGQYVDGCGTSVPEITIKTTGDRALSFTPTDGVNCHITDTKGEIALSCDTDAPKSFKHDMHKTSGSDDGAEKHK